MKEIQLSNGGIALIDDEDFYLVCQHKWFRHVKGYAFTNKMYPPQYLHRLIMGYPQSAIDHINRNKLDCRKANLRHATRSQNAINTGRKGNNTSGHTGVNYDTRISKWYARIKIANNPYFLGRFDDKLDAVRMRALAELRFRKFIKGA